MSAPIPVSSTTAGGDARLYEPSMEEILASIRRIIADDQSLPGRRGEADTSPAEDTPATVHVLRADADDHLGRTDAARAEQHAAPAAEPAPQHERASETLPPALATDPAATAEPGALGTNEPPAITPTATETVPMDHVMSEPVLEQERSTAVEPAPALVSMATNSAVSSAFNVLAASRLADNSAELLGMTREMVRPLLRAWLDDNLPAMVERLVRDEIERVARGGR